MGKRITSILPELGRPLVIGEYPYYRADPAVWERNIKALKQNGIDIISFYVPWRFHEISCEEPPFFDFTGETHPQKNLLHLLYLISAAGLKVLIKPGPFIHAEVQLGGLPDRLCAEKYGTSFSEFNGKPLLSQGRKLPSFFDATIRQQSLLWLETVNRVIVRHHSYPFGPIIAVQLGNEGIYSDASFSIEKHDVSEPAIHQFLKWLEQNDQDAADCICDGMLDWRCDWHRHWAEWTAVAMVQNWRWLASFYPPDLPKLVNIPLVKHEAQNTLAAWLMRNKIFHDAEFFQGHTEWIGNAANDRQTFISHVIGIMSGQTDTYEANWGFTWTDKSFAKPHVPLFHAMLGLMLGSTSCSIYTACATENWGMEIDLNPEGLRSDGLDPNLYGPPYCPGAPLRENGGIGENAAALGKLTFFLQKYGAELLVAHLVKAATIYLPNELIIDMAMTSNHVTLNKVCETIKDLLFKEGLLIDIKLQDKININNKHGMFNDEIENNLQILQSNAAELSKQAQTHHMQCRSQHNMTAIIRRESLDKHKLFLGFFNPGPLPDYISLTTPAENSIISVAAGSAVIHYYVNNCLVDSLQF